ncbi:MAG: hypothetical protein Q8L93_03650 [Rhodocyclaceae bacterium]|nr:hypothetical protein [Rhodocyclaceae bacterium]MDP1957930.1 hypothetical protein [Rhodocyclaceae bacterium]
MTGPTQEFWQERFASGSIPWDRGEPNPQLAAWLTDGTLAPGSRVIVPGCGQGWGTGRSRPIRASTTPASSAPNSPWR